MIELCSQDKSKQLISVVTVYQGFLCSKDFTSFVPIEVDFPNKSTLANTDSSIKCDSQPSYSPIYEVYEMMAFPYFNTAFD